MALKRFKECLYKEKFIRKQFVYREGLAADFVYIVKQGEFVLEKKLPRNETEATVKISEMLGRRKREKDGSLHVTNVL